MVHVSQGLQPVARTRRRFGRVAIWAALIVGAILCLFPFAWLVRSSLMTDAQIFDLPPAIVPNPVTFRNYIGAFTSQPFFGYFLNTASIEVFVIPGILLTCSLVAFSFARLRWRGRDQVFAVLLTGLMLPYAATLIPTFIGWQSIGMVGTYVPLIAPAWFAGAGGGMASVFLLRQFFRTIPQELDEAAYLDGATPWRVYWQIILPLSRPALLVVGVFTFFAVWNDFLNPLVYISDPAQFTLSLGLAAFKGAYSSEWGYLMAASTIVTLPVVIIFFFSQRQLLEGIAVTGLKG